MVPGQFLCFFHGSRSVFMTFCGSRSVFLVLGQFLRYSKVPGCFFLVFHNSRLVFYGFRLVYIQAERARREVRR